MRKLFWSLFFALMAVSPSWAGAVGGGLPIVGAITGLSGNMQAVAYGACLIGGTLCLAGALRHHHDWGAIGTGAVGVIGVSALALGMAPMLALIPGVGATVI